MHNLFLQLWGSLYLLNKIFFSIGERTFNAQNKKKWFILAWITFLIALPAWVILFILKNNWIAVTVEVGAAPSMVVGLFIAWRGKGTEPYWLHWFSKIAALFGLLVSFYNFGGITSLNQILELGIAIGFLIGTYQLANKNPDGYIWFVLEKISCAILMGYENCFILTIQQVMSLLFILDAYFSNKRFLIRENQKISVINCRKTQ